MFDLVFVKLHFLSGLFILLQANKNNTIMKRFKAIFSIILILGILVWSGCKKDEDKDVLANFSFELTTNPGEVIFTNSSSNADIYEWDFGDGFDEVTFINPVHTFENNGSYVVTLTAKGGSGTDTYQDTILVDNYPATIASYTYRFTSTPGEVKFTNTSINAVMYEWNFGDGSYNVMTNPTHVYTDNDTYIVILKAFGSGGNNSVQDTVLVDNIP